MSCDSIHHPWNWSELVEDGWSKKQGDLQKKEIVTVCKRLKSYGGLELINILEWLSQCPNLNPIQNLWQDLKIVLEMVSIQSD